MGVERELCSFLGCDVEFGADRDEVAFPEAVKSMPVVSADPYLNKILLRYCEDALADRVASRGSLRPDLENAIAPLLPHGKARAGEVARKLGMSERSLARRLSAEGLTFTGVGRVETWSRRQLFEGTGPAHFTDAGFLVIGGQRIHACLQTLDREDAGRCVRARIFHATRQHDKPPQDRTPTLARVPAGALIYPRGGPAPAKAHTARLRGVGASGAVTRAIQESDQL
jgi:AraC-like DNA-binding protein